MGVDYYSCDECGESRYSEYVGSCTDCGASLCTHCLVNDDVNSNYAHEYGVRFHSENLAELEVLYGDMKDSDTGEFIFDDDELIDDTSICPKYCPYCSGDKVNQEEIFQYIVTKYKLNVAEEWAEYKKTKDDLKQ
jgi:hypothetical protein